MASIQKRSNGYRAFICVNGRRESKVFRTQREAKAWADARTYEIRKEANKPERDTMPLAHLMSLYAEEVSPTKRGASKERIRIASMLADPIFPSRTMIGDVTPDLFALWRDARLREVKPGTVLRDIALLSAVFDHAIKDRGLITENPLHLIRKPNRPQHRDSLYTRAQIRTILKAMGHSPRGEVRSVAQAVATCFLVALRTGMRAGELSGLTWDRVYPDHVFLPVTKTIKRNVPLSAKAMRLIERMRGYDPLLVFGVTPQSLDANFRKYRTRAGVEGMTFHDSRHYAATQLAKKVDVLTLCKIFGWTNTKQALTYFNPSASDIARMLD